MLYNGRDSVRIFLWLGAFVAFIMVGGLFLLKDREEERGAYRVLIEKVAGERLTAEAPIIACQRRRGLVKLFVEGGLGARRSLLVECDAAQLALRRADKRTELVEEMEGVKAQWQEALYAAPPASLAFEGECQLVRRLETERAFYYPSRRSILASSVTWQQVVAPAHTLPCLSVYTLQSGSADEVAMHLGKGGVQWRARGLSFKEEMPWP